MSLRMQQKPDAARDRENNMATREPLRIRFLWSDLIPIYGTRVRRRQIEAAWDACLSADHQALQAKRERDSALRKAGDLAGALKTVSQENVKHWFVKRCAQAGSLLADEEYKHYMKHMHERIESALVTATKQERYRKGKGIPVDSVYAMRFHIPHSEAAFIIAPEDFGNAPI